MDSHSCGWVLGRVNTNALLVSFETDRCQALCHVLTESAQLLQAHAVKNVHCSTDAQRNPVSLRFFCCLLRTGLISLLTSLLMLPESLGPLLTVAPAGPAAWNVLPLSPLMTGSLSPTGAGFAHHPLTRLSLSTPSNTEMPSSFFAPFCFISHHYPTQLMCNLFVLLILYFPITVPSP